MKSQNSFRCAVGCQDWMLVTWIETRHQPQLSMTAVMTEPLLRALHLGADLFRLRHCPHHRCDAA